MLAVIDGLGGRKPPLVLHSCCAPCSTRCVEELFPFFDLTVLYYNPNIDTDEEYEKRAAEEKRFLTEYAGEGAIKFVDCGHREEDFSAIAKGREDLPERGARCHLCYRLRLEEAAKHCPEGGFFATTLTLSPLKSADVINAIGYELAEKYGVNYLPSDFKKRGGYLRSCEMSKEYHLYRQDYCGCRYSRRT
ncbi:MAG: epoxyqueuosine reductase QueH [Clostridia bacterium]|nr:epoxyqueuosine reductase QueH [Clostridia bacterium]